MKKIFSFVAAALVAVAVSAQTDFSTPYYCAADDAVLTGGSSSNFFLKSDVTPHCVAWSDVSLSYLDYQRYAWLLCFRIFGFRTGNCV